VGEGVHGGCPIGIEGTSPPPASDEPADDPPPF
jgi:hypothetical protein